MGTDRTPTHAHTPTHAQRYRDAVWETDQLTTVEKLVALAYADHCRNGTDTAWVAQRRLMQRCGIRSERTVVRVRAQLVEKGWLQQAGPSTRHRQATLYRLTPAETDALSTPVSAEQPVYSVHRSKRQPVHSRRKPMHFATETDVLSTPDRCTSDTPPSRGGPSVRPSPADAGAAPDGAPAPPGTRSPAAEAALAQLRAKLPRGELTRPGRVAEPPPPYQVDRDRYDPDKAQRLAERQTEPEEV